MSGRSAVALLVLLAALAGLTVPAGAASTAPPRVGSVAALPFANSCGGARQDYFAAGFSQDLRAALARLNGLQVAGRASSLALQVRQVDYPTAARKLNVAALLEGGVCMFGHAVRVTMRLIDGASGLPTWSQSFAFDLKDSAATRTAIALAVASRLQVDPPAEGAATLELGSTNDAQAYDEYLHGLVMYYKATRAAAFRDAAVRLDRAISRDPNFAAAHAQRARALIGLSALIPTPGRRAEVRERARRSAERAVALAPQLAEAHLALGVVRAAGFLDFAAAAPEYARALELAPGSAEAQAEAAWYYGLSARPESAVAAARRAVGLDPVGFRAHLTLTEAYYYGRRFSEALAAIEQARQIEPDAPQTAAYAAFSYLALGRYDAARQTCESRSVRLDEDDRHWCLAVAYHALGKPAQAQAQLAGLKALDGEAGAFFFAEVYAQWGDRTAALKALATAMRLHNAGLRLLKVDWPLDPIRDEPQFQQLAQQLKFPPSPAVALAPQLRPPRR